MSEDTEEKEYWTCPECNETTPEMYWRDTEVGCEDCGDHPAHECPLCDEVFDSIHSKIDDATEPNTELIKLMRKAAE